MNGDAEAGPGTDGASAAASVPGWTATGSVNVVTYASGYDLTDTGIVPVKHGRNYFTGGPSSGASTLTQRIDLTGGATNIDAGTVTFDASAYLGGNGDDNSTLRVEFSGSSGNQLSTVILGPVSAADRPDSPAIYFRRQIGPVPAGARAVTVSIQFNPSGGTKNRAYADNVVLLLNNP